MDKIKQKHNTKNHQNQPTKPVTQVIKLGSCSGTQIKINYEASFSINPISKKKINKKKLRVNRLTTLDLQDGNNSI